MVQLPSRGGETKQITFRDVPFVLDVREFEKRENHNEIDQRRMALFITLTARNVLSHDYRDIFFFLSPLKSLQRHTHAF